MKKKTRNRVKNMPLGTKICTYMCLLWALIVALVPLIWLVLSSLKEDPDGKTWISSCKSIYLEGRDFYFPKIFMLCAILEIVYSYQVFLL